MKYFRVDATCMCSSVWGCSSSRRIRVSVLLLLSGSQIDPSLLCCVPVVCEVGSRYCRSSKPRVFLADGGDTLRLVSFLCQVL